MRLIGSAALAAFLSSTGWSQPYVISTFAGGGLPPLPAPATSISIGLPSHPAIDAGGNIYFAGLATLFKRDRNGEISRVAGNARGGYSGDGGPAINAQISILTGLAVDKQGNIFLADSDCDCVRKIDTNGNINLFAGNRSQGASGDGGPASKAQLNSPMGLAVDAAGNLYIADAGNNRIRKVSAVDGTIQTVAGTGPANYTGDNVPATQSALNQPEDVALDLSGDLYIADTFNCRVRMVNLQGIITTFAGNGTCGYAGDNGNANQAEVYRPVAIATDPQARMVYVATDSFLTPYASTSIYPAIRVVSGGIIETFAGGGGTQAPTLTNGKGAYGTIFGGSGMAVDSSGNLLVSPILFTGIGEGLYQIWQISSSGIATPLAGNGYSSYSGDGGRAASAQFTPSCIAVDSANNIYISDQSANVVRRIAPSGVISTVAGNGRRGYTGDFGPATKAQIEPTCVTADKSNNLYITDSSNSVVRKVSAVDGTIVTVAGTGQPGTDGDGGPAVDAKLRNPDSVAVDAAGNIYIADTGNCEIRKVTKDGLIQTIAGQLQPDCNRFGTPPDPSGDGVAASSAVLSSPQFIVANAAGDVWFVDSNAPNAQNAKANFGTFIRKIDASDGIIHTIAGQGSAAGDGIAASTSALDYFGVQEMALDTAGNLFFTVDAPGLPDKRVRKIDTKGILTTIAGDGMYGYIGDGGAALQAEFTGAYGVTVDSVGNIYVGDHAVNAIGYLTDSFQLLRSYSGPGAGAIRMLTPKVPGSAIGAVTNAASNLPGPIAPGEIVTIYGSGLGPAVSSPILAGPDSTGSYPTQLSGTSVLFNNTPAPMIYTVAGQIAAVVPYEISGPNVEVAVQYQGTTGAAVMVPVAASNPALFTFGSGKGQAAAINQDGTLNGAAHPAHIGEVVVLFATGEGATSPAGVDGMLTVGLPKPVLAPSLTIGGVTAQLMYAGEAPGEIAGLLQINAVVPAGVPAGNAPVMLTLGTASSPTGITIAVAQ